MSIYPLLGYLLVCMWQPIQIVKVLLTQDVESLSPVSVGTLTLGMILIQIGFIKDKAGLVYKWGNGFAIVASLVLLTLYFIYI